MDTLLMILGGVSAVVLVLISILGYVMIVKHKENHVSSDNKFSVLDDQGKFMTENLVFLEEWLTIFLLNCISKGGL